MKKFTEWMHDLSGALMVIGQTIIAAFGVIVILCFIVYVEIQRVAHGVMLFEQNGAYLGAAVLVITLLTLEFIIHYVETKHGYQHTQKTEYSLKIAASRAKYFLGFDNDWKPRFKSPAHDIKIYSRLLTLTILSLALGGSMENSISTVQGTWIDGLQSIMFQSSLSEIVEWVSGVLFALTLVIGSQRITAYVAQRASETLSSTSNNSHPEIVVEKPITITSPDVDQKALPFVDMENVAICPDCGWQSTPKDSEANAKRALLMHQRSCEACNEPEVTS